ncbi:MAG TPA: D-cysteine desulfhydrase family protein [Steroidobacteraceae bacterium]|nr:D-cysteine desulfhydrase family protein [Steroidobacteraceae bacterium]
MLPVESLCELRGRLDPALRLNLARKPTPLQPLPRLSELLGASIYCMRDDQTGFGFGGNKIRKLEYLLYEARKLRSDTLVTCGSNQSNWCCMAAVAGAVLGMEVRLVLGGAQPLRDTGNIRLARIVGARMSHVDTSDGDELERASQALTQELQAQGKRPYRMIMGGSTGLGALGYAEAFSEIVQFERTAGVTFSKVIHASGSAGTQAGLIAGAMLNDWRGDIIGMAVSRSSAEQRQKVHGVLRQVMAEHLIETRRILVEDAFVGAGYRQNTQACLAAIETFALREGIFLDEVYTGKAAAGLIEYARDRRFARDEHVLFLHTGGAAQLFE